MRVIATFLLMFIFSVMPNIAYSAEQKAPQQEPIAQTAQTAQTFETSKEPEVGKHVMANMDATSMILSLIMVLIVIIASAFVLKRFNIVQQGGGHLKVVANLSLGAKERVVVVQAGEQQLILGVTAQQITLIDKLEQPLVKASESQADSMISPANNVTSSVLRLLKKNK